MPAVEPSTASLADIRIRPSDDRFTPVSRHRQLGEIVARDRNAAGVGKRGFERRKQQHRRSNINPVFFCQGHEDNELAATLKTVYHCSLYWRVLRWSVARASI
jgi:hypothetical protein